MYKKPQLFNDQRIRIFIIIIVLLLFTILGFILGRYSSVFENDKVRFAYYLIKNYAFANPDSTTLIKGLLEGLNDPYSYYLDKNEYAKYLNSKVTNNSLKFTKVNTVIFLTITSFQESTKSEYATIQNELKDATKIVIDLRDNLGGTTESSLYILDSLIIDGVLLIEKIGDQKYTTQATGKAFLADVPLFVLINNETSSTAEQFASAIQDNNRGTLIGKSTFGKVSIGNYYTLPDGSAIHLTIGEWCRANGETIRDIGVIPDYEVDLGELKQTDIVEAINLLGVN